MGLTDDKVRIMFIDDDPIDQALYRRMCRRADDVESIEFYSYADDALEELARRPDALPDLVFLDMRIPRMSGIEFLQAVESLDGAIGGQLNVIIATTSIHPDDKAAATAFPFVKDFATKPISKEQLQMIISRLREEP